MHAHRPAVAGRLNTTHPTRLLQPLIQRGGWNIQIPRRMGWVGALNTNQIHRLFFELTGVMLVGSTATLHDASIAATDLTGGALGAHALFGEYHSALLGNASDCASSHTGIRVTGPYSAPCGFSMLWISMSSRATNSGPGKCDVATRSSRARALGRSGSSIAVNSRMRWAV